MSEILMLNGASRKDGNTARLARAFAEGAKEAGHEVREFYLQTMRIGGCLGCNACKRAKDADLPCVQQDDMEVIYPVFRRAEVVVFVSPVYFWTVSGPLKTATDRLYAALSSLGYGGFERKSVLLMTAGGSDYSQAIHWYETFERNLGWTNLGEILGAGKTAEAKALGKAIR